MSLTAVVGSLWEIYKLKDFLIFNNHMYTITYSKIPFLFFILYILYTLADKTAKVPRKNKITNDVATVTYTKMEFPVK